MSYGIKFNSGRCVPDRHACTLFGAFPLSRYLSRTRPWIVRDYEFHCSETAHPHSHTAHTTSGARINKLFGVSHLNAWSIAHAVWPPACSAIERKRVVGVSVSVFLLRRTDESSCSRISDKKPRSKCRGHYRKPRTASRLQSGMTDWRQRLPVLSNGVLTLRELRMSDAEALLDLLSTEEVSRFISPPPTSVDGFERFIAWAQRERAAGRYICFAVVPDGMDTAIGIFQVRHSIPRSRPPSGASRLAALSGALESLPPRRA